MIRFWFCLICIPFSAYSQVLHLEIAANSTDSKIDKDYLGTELIKHQVFVSQSQPSKSRLLVFLPGTGARPGEHYSNFCRMAAAQGYHVIGLVYKNTVSISQLCGTQATSDSLCSEKARMEIIYGNNLSDGVEVDAHNSIMNRVIKLLVYLDEHYPSAQWDQFINPKSQRVLWSKVTLAGHSQGGGHAALIARDSIVGRVIFFNSPSDKNKNLDNPLQQPSWFYDRHQTADSSYYAFFHMQNLGPTKLKVYDLFGLSSFGKEVNIDEGDGNWTSHILFTDSSTFNHKDYINPSCGSGAGYNPHSDIIVDCELPYNGAGDMPFEKAWLYLLNNSETVSHTRPRTADNVVALYPNPTSGSLNIHTSLAGSQNMALFTISGTRVPIEIEGNTIDLGTMPPGQYFLWSLNHSGETQIFQITKI